MSFDFTDPNSISDYIVNVVEELDIAKTTIEEKEEQARIIQNDIDDARLDFERKIAKIILVDNVITGNFLKERGYDTKISKAVRDEILGQ